MIVPTPPGSGVPLFAATLRAMPEDFRVDERLSFRPDGGGEHLWLRLEKRLLNTADVLALLARVYGVGSADIGVSGYKDRRAVTRQWFSVRTALDVAPLEAELARDPRALLDAVPRSAAGGKGGHPTGNTGGGRSGIGDIDDAGLAIVDAVRHPRKLRRGTHVSNAFSITLRDVRALSGGTDADTADGVDERRMGAAGEAAIRESFAARLDLRLARLATHGFPNYIGPQRFGRGGQNVERARAWFRQPRRRATRVQRGLWLSAARSILFNRVCAERVAEGSWNRLLPGEPVTLDGTRSFFVPDDRSAGMPSADVESLLSRLARGDVHPSAPWWGRGESLAHGACREFEEAALAGTEELRTGLERVGLAQERRALRALPRSLAAGRPDARTIRFTFGLPPGVYATTLLAEFGLCRVATGG